MCKFNQCLRTLCKRSTKIHAICVNLTTQYVWAWVNFDHNLRCLLKDLCTQQKFYASASRTGRNKYHGWTPSKSENMTWTTKRLQQRQIQRQWQMHLENTFNVQSLRLVTFETFAQTDFWNIFRFLEHLQIFWKKFRYFKKKN